MRTNLPVTENEYEIQDGDTLVSTTDLTSHITYCNPAFLSVSGYNREELIGQPHNLIRHPDMPSEAFRDMWATLKSGQPWSALVKNRRKNGDYYWVVANATPVVADGQTVGYMSVRTKPTRPQIEAAESLYKDMRVEAKEGRATLSLHRGQLVRSSLLGRLQSLTRMTLARQLGAICLSLVTLGFVISQLTRDVGPGLQAVFMAALLGLGLMATWWLRHRIEQPMQEAVRFANQMAAGDLSARLEPRGVGVTRELNQALNQLNVNLQAVVSDVREEVRGVRLSSAEIASGNQDLSSRTESQASSLEQTAASMNEINSTVQQSNQSAREATLLAGQATNVAEQCNTAVSELVSTMGEISRSSGRIGEIIQVIDSISFQTNILALNAAVEAARAGEQGRGFAVVAAEVRQLAQRTLDAAKEIKALIEESSSKVHRGTAQVHSAGQSMSGMVQTVGQVSALIAEITHASDEQSLGISQINQAVNHMDSVTQQNSAMVEQLAAAASSLQEQAKTMEDAVGIFRLDGKRQSKT